jgi:hypothetical protein
MTFLLDLRRELHRLGAEVDSVHDLLADPSIPADAVLRWLRWLPTGIGVQELAKRMTLPAAEGGPHIAMEPEELMSFEPDHPDPELDTLMAFERELRRIVLPAIRASGMDEMHGFALPTRNPAAALDNLRRLPDGASLEDVMNALRPAAPNE